MPTPLLAALTAAPGPHPTTGELRDYAAGSLPPAAQQRIEAHALACPRCADALAGWQQTPAAPADAAVARLRQRLRQRVQELEPMGTVPPPPAVVLPTGAGSPLLGAALRRWAAAAAVAGLSVVGLWAWQHRTGAELAQPTVALETAAPNAEPAPAPAPADLTTAADKTLAQAAPEPAADALAQTAPKAPAAAAALPRPARPAPLLADAPARPRPTTAAAAAPKPPANGVSDAAAAAAEAPTAAGAGVEAATAAAPAAAAPASAPGVAYDASAKSKALKTEQADDQEADRADRSSAPTAAAGRARSARALPDGPRSPVGAAASPSPTALPAPAPVAPAPVGGWLALRERLRRQAADFDPAETASRLTGTVHLRLLIGADGRVQKTEILRGLRPDYDAEALRLTTETAPRWQPGLANGRRAALPVEITVPF